MDEASQTLYQGSVKKPPHPQPLPRGMKIQLKGLRSAKELRAMLHEAADRIEALNIPYVRGVNLYLTPANGKGEPLTRLGRQKFADMDIVIDGPYRSAADEYNA